MNDINTTDGFRTSPQQDRVVSLLGSKACAQVFHQVEWRLDGQVDPERLQSAVQMLRAEHEILRTHVLLGSSRAAIQVVSNQATPCDVSLVQEGKQSVLRIRLDVLNGDCRTLPQILRLLSEAYRKGSASDAEVMQYPDLAEAFHELLTDTQRTSYWTQRTAPWLAVPGMQQSPPRYAVGSRSRLSARVDLSTALAPFASAVGFARANGQEEPVSPDGLAFALWVLFVSKLCQQSDVGVGYVDPGTRALLGLSAIGPMLRVLPLHFALDWSKSAAFLVREIYNQWQRDCGNGQFYDASGASLPLIQPSFVYESVEDRPAGFAGMAVVEFVDRRVHESHRLKLTAEADHHLLSADALVVSANDFADLVSNFERWVSFCATRGSLPVGAFEWVSGSTPNEVSGFASATSHGGSGYELVDIRAAVRNWARINPDEPALADEGGRISYRELDRRIDAIASRLLEAGLGSRQTAAIHLPRGSAWVTYWLACWQLNVTVLPLSVLEPAGRVIELATRGGATHAISGESCWNESKLAVFRPDDASALYEAKLGGDPCLVPLAHDIAYLLYTSGSTGNPKAVSVSHGALSNYLRWAQIQYRGSGRGGSVAHSELTFDFTQTVLWLPLLSGACLHFIPQRAGLQELRSFLERHPDLTFIKVTPAHLQGLSALERNGGSTVRWPEHVIVGGAAFTGAMLPQSLASASATRIHNEYGPTEAAVGCCIYSAPADELPAEAVSIGTPCEGNGLFVLDPYFNRLPSGSIGELHIDGEQLATGYLGNPRETAQRFLPNPFSPAPGKRLYRTGDLARRGQDGRYEFAGRTDTQIKLRGYRIELEEITAQLLLHPQISAVHTAFVESGSKAAATIVSYVVSHGIVERDLIAWLRGRLPHYMIPSQLVNLSELPCSAHGKIDTERLDALRAERCPPAAAQTDAERLLAGIWSNVLGVSNPGIDSDFFSLGGDSIRSIQVVVAARAAGRDISVEQIFDFPTIRELARAASISVARGQRADAFSLVTPADRAALPVEVIDAYPVAQLQLAMIFHHEMEATRSVYHDIFSYRLNLDLDFDSLRTAARNLVARHPALRTTFDITSYSQPLQLVWQEGPEILDLEDLSHLDPTAQTARIFAAIEEEKRRGFDVTQLPLVRIKLHRLEQRVVQLTTSFQHAIMDGWSDQQIHTELFEEYAALRSGTSWSLAPPLATYRDYVAVELELLRSEEVRSFWMRHLAGSTPLSLGDLPADGSGGEVGNVRTSRHSIASELGHRLRSTASSLNVHLRTVLLAAHYRVLAVVAGDSEVVSGVVSNCRLEQQDGERCIGLFINSIPLRVRTGGRRWSELITQLHQLEREVHSFRRLPLAEIQRAAGRDKLSDALFYFTNFHNGIRANAAMQSQERYSHEASSFPVVASFNVDPESAAISFSLMTDGRGVSARRAQLLADLYMEALRLIGDDVTIHVDARPLCAPDMRSILRGTEVDETIQGNFVSMFESEVLANPTRIAVSGADESLTFGELNSRSNRITAGLIGEGVRADDSVAVMLPRGSMLVVALVAVLKSGASFVTVDKDEPAQRLALISSQCRFAITSDVAKFAVTSLRDKVIDPSVLLAANPDVENPCVKILPNQAAYKMYTSGTTGMPKCVVVGHHAYANVLRHFRDHLKVTASDIVLATSAMSFDISLLEVGLPLICGARLHVLTREEVTDVQTFATIIDAVQATIVQATPSLWALLRNAGWQGSRKLTALSGGEKLPRQLALWLLERAAAVWDLYGPTETTIWSAAKRIRAEELTLGRPIAHTRCYVLDEALLPVPRGSVGTLYIAGAGLARGYEGRPAQTSTAFLPDPFSLMPGQRMYCTGDRVVVNHDQELEFRGRNDRQIKVRGHRLELEEIEHWLQKYDPCRSVLVTYGTGQLREELIAYIVPKQAPLAEPSERDRVQQAGLGAAELRAHLSQFLPAFALPTRFQLLREIPRTRNGKIDYAALPSPGAERPPLANSYRGPATAMEYVLQELWSKVLKIDKVGTHDDFLELGGYSLTAIQIVFHLRKLFAVSMPVGAVFEAPTIERMGGYLLRSFPEASLEEKADILMTLMREPQPAQESRVQ